MIALIGLALEKFRLPENRELHGGALGHDLVMTDLGQHRRSSVRGTSRSLVAAAAYEALARSGYFAPALLPTLPTIARTLFAGIADGKSDRTRRRSRFIASCSASALSVVVGLPLGILMARFQRVEHFFLPLRERR